MDEDILELPEDLEDVEVIYSDGEDDDYVRAIREDADNDEFQAEVIDISKLNYTNHTSSVFSSALSKDGALAVTGGEDDVAYVWTTSDGATVFECTGHKDSVTEVGFSYNDQYVATGDMGGMIQVWSVSDHKLVWCFEGDEIEWMTWHPLGNILICGVKTGAIYVWQIPSGNCKVLPSPDHMKCTCGSVLPNGRQLVAGYNSGQIRLWDIKEATTVWSNYDNDLVNSITINSDASLLVTTPKARIIKISDGKTIGQVLLEGEDEIEAALFDNDLGVVVTGSLAGQLCVWQLGKFTIRHQAKIECSVTLMKAGSDNKVFVGAVDGAVYVCDVKSGTLLDVLTGHVGGILSIQVFGCGNRILTTSDDYTARIFQFEN